MSIINNKYRINAITKHVFIQDVSDFPTPVSGVITLEQNTTYHLINGVDLLGNRLVVNEAVAIVSDSYFTSILKSTGLTSGAIITATKDIELSNLTIETNNSLVSCFNLQASSTNTYSLNINSLNCKGVGSAGLIKDYDNVLIYRFGLLSGSGLTVDGIINTLGFNECFFNANSDANVAITTASTLEIIRRFRVTYSAFVITSGQIGIEIDALSTLPIEGFILDTVNFAGGSALYISGLNESDNESKFSNCVGITNTVSAAEIYFSANTTETVISVIDTYVKVAGTYIDGTIVKKFDTSTNGRVIFTGIISAFFIININASLESGNNQDIMIAIYKNGTIVPGTNFKTTTSGTGASQNISSQALIQLQKDDYIEVFAKNISATTNIKVTDINLIISSLK